MEERLAEVEKQLKTVQERNTRVETDKAWEISTVRKVSIAAVTYVIAVLAFIAIGNENPFRNALIPTLGFLLSTLSLPFVKKWWARSR